MHEVIQSAFTAFVGVYAHMCITIISLSFPYLGSVGMPSALIDPRFGPLYVCDLIE